MHYLWVSLWSDKLFSVHRIAYQYRAVLSSCESDESIYNKIKLHFERRTENILVLRPFTVHVTDEQKKREWERQKGLKSDSENKLTRSISVAANRHEQSLSDRSLRTQDHRPYFTLADVVTWESVSTWSNGQRDANLGLSECHVTWGSSETSRVSLTSFDDLRRYEPL